MSDLTEKLDWQFTEEIGMVDKQTKTVPLP